MIQRVKRKLNSIQKRLVFAEYCFSRGNDHRFVQAVKEIGKYPEFVFLEKGNGEQEAEVFYHIYMEESKSGFFADHNKLLEYLFFADYYHLIPVVEYTDRYCYAERHPVNGTTNPFEYYFEQPAGIDLNEMRRSTAIIHSRKDNIMLAKQLNPKQDGYSKSDKYLEQMGRISQKYIHLQPRVKEWIEGEKKRSLSLCNGNVLGVHVRGTDFKRNYNGHPIAVTLDEYEKETEILMNTGKYDKIFLATDDENAVESFGRKFPDKLVFYTDVIRSKGTETVMKSESLRENHHYKLGLEVLRDMYTLANCDGLIAGLSQVSFAARIQKLSMGKHYTDMRILDKGLNYHRAQNCQ
ncbi:MAG TPA: O-fucosyltransferase family protein [Candidatus Eisenbergiella pullicola]|nr:O-fucosyltransferase family protein [Candidatus Eisenbergiella pullicola]